MSNLKRHWVKLNKTNSELDATDEQKIYVIFNTTKSQLVPPHHSVNYSATRE